MTGEDGLEGLVVERQRFRVCLEELGIAEAGLRGTLPSEGEHVRRDVGGQHAPARGYGERGGQGGLAVTRSEVEDGVAGAEPGELRQPACHGLAAGVGFQHVVPLALAGRRGLPLGALGLLEGRGIEAVGGRHRVLRWVDQNARGGLRVKLQAGCSGEALRHRSPGHADVDGHHAGGGLG